MTTPSTAVGAMWKSRPIVGSATFTMVMSMMFMNMADTNTAPTMNFWLMRGTATWFFLFAATSRAAAEVSRTGTGPRRPFDPIRVAGPDLRPAAWDWGGEHGADTGSRRPHNFGDGESYVVS